MLNVQKSFHKKFPDLIKKSPKWAISLLVRFLEKLFHEKEFNAVLSTNEHLRGLAFVNSTLEKFKMSYTVDANQLKNIPATGKLIVISNHPTGAQDSFSLVQLIGKMRENKKVKILINDAFVDAPQGKSLAIPVSNTTGAITKSSVKAINEALENEEAVVIFPSGMVNRMRLKGLVDTKWMSSFFKIAQRTNTPILPVKIKGRNSCLFYFISFFLPKSLSGLMLAHEFAIAGLKPALHMTIGEVVPASSFSDKSISAKEYISMFYKHVYTLGTDKISQLRTETTITSPKNRKELKNEVNKAEYLGKTIDGKKIILANAEDSPFLIKELGRIREISFRAIGGGTGTARDNDLYDTYYKHMILWDDEDLEIVGAYRIGECKSIIKEKGNQGLYTSKLCDFKEEFKDYCDISVELGRSFVQPKYWGSRALDNLWQGIGAYLAHNPQIRYTYGTVTINADTPKKAVNALVYFYMLYFACTNNMMVAKTPYIVDEKDKLELEKMFDGLPYKEGFIVLKKHLKELGTSVPTLFKQYTELYEDGAVRFFGFNINEAWSGVVEGFIIADNSCMKEAKRKRYIENFQKLKITDPLTNLYNRVYFQEYLESNSKYQRKIDSDSALVLVDINNFNAVEDAFKDEALIKVSNKLKRTLRDNDVIAKWGNATFIVRLKNIKTEELNSVCLKLKESLNSIKVGKSLVLDCLIGCSMDNTLETSADTLKRAENALYIQKQIGYEGGLNIQTKKDSSLS